MDCSRHYQVHCDFRLQGYLAAEQCPHRPNCVLISDYASFIDCHSYARTSCICRCVLFHPQPCGAGEHMPQRFSTLVLVANAG